MKMTQAGFDSQLEAQTLRQMLRAHEGVRAFPYLDSVGKCTIAVGRNLSDRGLTVAEIDFLLETDIALAHTILDGWLPGWRDFSAPRRHALISMAFNLGGPRLASFVQLRAALMAGDFDRAADCALDSRWAVQTGRRALEIARLLRSGGNAPPPPDQAHEKEKNRRNK